MSKPKDRLWMGPELPSGNRPFVREDSKGKHAVGYLGPEATPRSDSLLELDHVQGCMYEVKSEVKFTASGPAQVASPAYRDGWSRVFGGKASVGQA